MGLPNNAYQLIIDAVKNRLAAISSTTEYNFVYTPLVIGDLTIPRVYDSHGAPWHEQQDYGINLNDDYNSLVGVDSSELKADMEMSLSIDLMAKGSSAANIRKHVMDVLKSVGQDITWGGLAYYTKLESIERDPVDHQYERVADARIKIKINYRMNNWGK